MQRPVTASSTETESAPSLSQQNYMKRYGKTIDMDDLKCCDCAYCGRELVGPSHREYAPQFKMKVAKMVHGRPYCPSCSKTVLCRKFTCMACQREKECLEVEFTKGIPYCLDCSEPDLPLWRNVLAIDRHTKGTIPNPSMAVANVETLATAASA